MTATIEQINDTFPQVFLEVDYNAYQHNSIHDPNNRLATAMHTAVLADNAHEYNPKTKGIDILPSAIILQRPITVELDDKQEVVGFMDYLGDFDDVIIKGIKGIADGVVDFNRFDEYEHADKLQATVKRLNCILHCHIDEQNSIIAYRQAKNA